MALKIADISKRLRIPERNIYRWMEAHPNLTERDPASKLGHPFPEPCGKEGRANVWDEEEVKEWWADNCKTIGRHPLESPIIIMKWDDFRKAMLVEPVRWTDEQGVVHVEDDMSMVEEFSRSPITDDVRVKFRKATDAVLFRLKY